MGNKVGFLAFLGSNYGTILQSFSLYQAIKNLGYDCEVIGANEFRNRPIPDPDITNIHSKEYDKQKTHITFEHFISRWFVFNEVLGNIPANAKLTERQIEEIPEFCSFVCGSDQIWKPAGFWFCAKRYLQFAPEEKRVSYAPSVGWNKIEIKAVGNIPQWRTWLSSVKYLSTRETTGSYIVEKLTGRSVPTVLDPTFLLTADDWVKLLPYGTVSDEINKQLMTGRPYMLAYLLDRYDKYNEYIKRLAERLDLEIIWLTGRDNVGPIQRNCANTDPAGFVNLVRNASFVCVDGYHGVCLSLNFSRPFVSLLDPETVKNDSRVTNLLDRLNIKGKIITGKEDPDDLDVETDYTKIGKLIDRERDFSLNYLNRSLHGSERAKVIKSDILDAVSIVSPKLKRTTNHVPLDNPDNCTGCGACMNICPVNAIKMLANEYGFLNPVVDEKTCIKCGKCLSNCPLRRRPPLYLREKNTVAYAAWAKNPFIISGSASGGMFPLMAKWILDRGGVAYGVAWDRELNARTICASNENELRPISGSKYVQADTGYIFKDVKEKLQKGIPVLFSGTSCQVAGLYAYLEGDHDFLITTDLICSGVPSPLIFKKYIKWREDQIGSKIINVEFRSKRKSGWGARINFTLESGKNIDFPLYQDEYGILFGQHLLQRPSCFVCRFRGVEKRWADITIGDFWGIGKQGIEFNYERSQGVSVVLTNSIKGKIFFQSIASDTKNIFVEKRPLEEVYPGNSWLIKNYGKRSDYKELYKLLIRMSFEDAFSAHFGDEDIRIAPKIF